MLQRRPPPRRPRPTRRNNFHLLAEHNQAGPTNRPAPSVRTRMAWEDAAGFASMGPRDQLIVELK
jgi:hypothetical protein